MNFRSNVIFIFLILILLALLDYQNRANAVNQAAAHMASGQLTPTGQYYKDLIRKNA